MTRHTWIPKASTGTMGIVFTIVNDVPDVSIRLPFNAILQVCNGAFRNDPFCVVYMQDDSRHWYKGEYCYSNKRYNFTAVGLAAVPNVILMMDMVKP